MRYAAARGWAVAEHPGPGGWQDSACQSAYLWPLVPVSVKWDNGDTGFTWWSDA